MILREITVRGVKCFRDECTVGRFGEGLNMIFGPNETGKSTLIEATARALFDDYSSRAESIKQLRPWGTSLAPEIVLEFAAEGDDYRLTKRLLADTLCRVERKEAGDWSALHERDAADEFVRELLHGEDAHGASDLRHWGLARTLWCLRDPCMIGRADDAACVVPSSVAGQIRSVLGEGTVATALDEVPEKVDARYDEYFTAARGNPKAGSPIETLREEIAELEDRQAEAEAALSEVEDAAGRLEDIEAELSDLEQERQRLLDEIDAHQEEAEKIEALQREIEDTEKALDQARDDRDDKLKDLERFKDARETAESAQNRIEGLDDDLEDLQADLKAARQLVEEATDDHREAQQARKAASDARDRGRKLEDALSLLEERQALAKLLAEIDELGEEHDELTEQLEAAPRPSDEDVERVATLEREIDRLKTQLEAAGLAATVEAHREQEVSLSGGDEDLRETVGEGGTVEYSAGSSLTVDLPDVARVNVSTGASEPAELQQALEEARDTLQELLAPWAAEDAAALRDLQREHERISEEIERNEERMQSAADPFDGPDQIQQRQFEVRSELTRRLNELELSEDELEEQDRPDMDLLEQRSRTAQGEEDRLQEVLNERRERADELSKRCEDAREDRSDLETTLRENEATMTTVLQRYDCDSEEDLQAVVDEAQADVTEREETLEQQRARLPSEEADPRQLIETARDAMDQVDRRREELLDQRGGVRGIIERAQTEGRYEQLSEIEEELATARRTLQRTWREAQAVKLLRVILDRRRHGVTSGALPGLEQKVSRMLRHITGRERALQMSEEMVVTGVVDDDAEHDPESLSSGTREQLDLVTRLALGETYVEAAGRTMMVLDDALLYTDPRRHDRVKQILQRAGELLQIFILTSHPQRYRGIVPTDCQFDLEAIRTSSG